MLEVGSVCISLWLKQQQRQDKSRAAQHTQTETQTNNQQREVLQVKKLLQRGHEQGLLHYYSSTLPRLYLPSRRVESSRVVCVLRPSPSF